MARQGEHRVVNRNQCAASMERKWPESEAIEEKVEGEEEKVEWTRKGPKERPWWGGRRHQTPHPLALQAEVGKAKGQLTGNCEWKKHVVAVPAAMMGPETRQDQVGAAVLPARCAALVTHKLLTYSIWQHTC